MYEPALRLLASNQAQPLGDLEVQRLRIEADAHAALHQFKEAEQGLGEADRLCAAAASASCGDLAGARGFLKMQREDYADARADFQEALFSARASGDQYLEASALLNLSWSALRLSHFDEDLDWANAARQIAVRQGFSGISQRALGNMGWASYRLGDPEKAGALLIEAAKQANRLGEASSQVGWLIDDGYIDLDVGKFAGAQLIFERCLALARQIDDRENIVTALEALAFVSERTDKLQDAKRYADDALSMAQADKNGRDIVYARLGQGRIAARLHDAATAETAFHEVAQSKDTPVFLKWEAERSLARLYEDENQSASAAREYRTALTTFETARSELEREDSRLPFLSNATHIYDDYIHFLVAQGKKDEALQVADFSRGRTLAEGLGLLPKETSFKPASLNAPEVARRAGGTILFYWLGEKQSYLWTITPQNTSLFMLPAGGEIDAAVQRYRQALSGIGDVLESGDADGQYLYRMLIQPAHAVLKKEGKVFVIPDGSLNNLNFETVLVPESNTPGSNVPGSKPSEGTDFARTPAKLHYWIEDGTVVNASSLRVLSGARSGATTTGAPRKAKLKLDRSLLLVGNSISPSNEYPELPQAAAQMQSVAEHFPAATEKILARQEATPAAYLASKPEQYSYIHFVAHGKASRLSPLDSEIVLSKASPQDDSFKLYARDIIQHPLRAELVTVSACYSAGERAYSGEGLVGLSWAFLRAGAHNVIGALWDATDAPTEQLMDKFYDDLNKGAAPAAALRTAKLSLLHGKFHNPFYWAPFQLYSRLQ
jgi:CHAT domain-containing protein